MNVNKINGVLGSYPSNSSPIKPNSTNIKDEVKISKDAWNKIETAKTISLVKGSPEVRAKEVALAKQNLEKYFENGALKESVANEVADKIIDDLIV